MIRVLTACGSKHVEYLDRLIASIPPEIDFIIDINNNEGKHVSMNRLINQVGHDDICYLIDADDWFNPCAFDKDRIALMEKYDFIYGDCMNIGDSGGVVYTAREFDLELLMRKNYIAYSTVMVRGWLLKKSMFDDTRHTGDWITWHKMLQYSRKFHYEPGVVAYRDVRTSYFDDHRPIIGKIKRLWRNHNAKRKIESIWC